LTHTLTSRRTVAGRFFLLAARRVFPLVFPLLAALCLSAPPARAQRHGGGGRPMGAGPGIPMGERPNMPPPGNRGNFGRPNFGPQGQPRMGLQLGLGGRWWDDHGTAHKLKLNSDQQHRMDDIFEANKPALVNLYINYQREESNLATLSPADLQDETKIFAAIDRVSRARTDLEKQYAHTFLQIRQQLDPTQLTALDHQIANLH
jgi:Spy/CpxP family protein refolding chaperone